MSSFLLHCSELWTPCISGCKPLHRRLILRGPIALKEAFAPEAVAPDFPLRAGGLLGLRPRAFYATSSDLVAIVRRQMRRPP